MNYPQLNVVQVVLDRAVNSMPDQSRLEDVALNEIMGRYFRVALSYLLLLPISQKYEDKSFNQLPKKIRDDLFKSTIKWMGTSSEFLLNKSPLEVILMGDSSLLEDHLKEMSLGGTGKKEKDS